MLWSEAVRVAVTEERLDVRAGIDLLPDDRRAAWTGWIDDAERPEPATDLRENGFTVTALQAAWHAIVSLPPLPAGVEYHGSVHLPLSLAAAVRIEGDTDTVAAIAGALLGARYGCAAVPAAWERAVHGWPELGGRRLGALGRVTAQGGPGVPGTPEQQTCPLCGTRSWLMQRYPDHVCGWCAHWVTDREGRPVRLSNVSHTGGFTARYDDGTTAADEVLAGRVWVDGVEMYGQEMRMGSTVVRLPAGVVADPDAVRP